MIQGLRFDDYEVLADSEGKPVRLGESPYGVTCLARHAAQGGLVALKILHSPMFSNAKAREYLNQSLERQSHLRHPNVASLQGYGERGGEPYCIQEFCHGGDLRALLKKTGPLDEEMVLLLGKQMLDGLQGAHRQGYLHANIKPSSILLSHDAAGRPQVKISDFGLMQKVQQTLRDEGITDLEKRNLYTPEYASPEQVREDALDERTDLFSLGMTLWHLLKGHTPCTGSIVRVLSERMKTDLSYEPQLPDSLTPPARQFLARLLEKEREKRFASAQEALSALDAMRLNPRRLDELLAHFPPPPVSADAAAPPPAPQPRRDRRKESWTQHFRVIDEKRRELVPGTSVKAMHIESQERVTLDLQRPGLSPRLVESMQASAEKLRQGQIPGLQQLVEVTECREGWMVMWDLGHGEELLSTLRRLGKVQLSEVAAFLARLAISFDRVHELHLPGIAANPAEVRIYIDENDPAAADRRSEWLAVHPLLRPILVPPSSGGSGVHSADMTMVTRAGPASDVTMGAAGGGSGEEQFSYIASFGSLIYFMIGGRPPSMAARLSANALVKLSGLGEAGNILLGRAIAGEFEDAKDCREFLRELLKLENISSRTADAILSGQRDSGPVSTPVAHPRQIRTHANVPSDIVHPDQGELPPPPPLPAPPSQGYGEATPLTTLKSTPLPPVRSAALGSREPTGRRDVPAHTATPAASGGSYSADAGQQPAPLNLRMPVHPTEYPAQPSAIPLPPPPPPPVPPTAAVPPPPPTKQPSVIVLSSPHDRGATQSGKGKWIAVAVIFILAVAGFSGWLIWKNNRDKQDGSSGGGDKSENQSGGTSASQQTSSGSSQGGGTTGSTTSTGTNTSNTPKPPDSGTRPPKTDTSTTQNASTFGRWVGMAQFTLPESRLNFTSGEFRMLPATSYPLAIMLDIPPPDSTAKPRCFLQSRTTQLHDVSAIATRLTRVFREQLDASARTSGLPMDPEVFLKFGCNSLREQAAAVDKIKRHHTISNFPGRGAVFDLCGWKYYWWATRWENNAQGTDELNQTAQRLWNLRSYSGAEFQELTSRIEYATFLADVIARPKAWLAGTAAGNPPGNLPAIAQYLKQAKASAQALPALEKALSGSSGHANAVNEAFQAGALIETPAQIITASADGIVRVRIQLSNLQGFERTYDWLAVLTPGRSGSGTVSLAIQAETNQNASNLLKSHEEGTGLRFYDPFRSYGKGPIAAGDLQQFRK